MTDQQQTEPERVVTSVREVAIAAALEDEARRLAARAAAVEAQRLEEERLDRAALTRVRSSLLAAWFPDVEWVVVYRSDGSSPWFVVHPDGEPELKLVLLLDDNGGEGEVRLPAASEDAAKVPRWLVRAVGVRDVTDLGRLLLDREREREAEAPVECDP